MAQCLQFIVLEDSNDEKAKAFLKQAAKEASDADIDVRWIAFDDLEREPSKICNEAVIVCETFEGNEFEKLKSQGRRIVGPACVIHCLRNIEPLPGVSHPVLSLSMSDIVACCTNISMEERSKLNERIVAMGGIMVGDFTQSVTHLIAGEVGSKKYKVACEIGVPIVQQSWVFACWSQSKYKLFESQDDEIVKKHLCPCFKGLTISVTGLGLETRKEVAQLTEKNGGKYSGDLNMRTCTHLIVNVAKGEKYTYARQWKIHCVSPEWFYDCLKEGHWVDEASYEVTPGDDAKFNSSKNLELGKSIVNVTVQNTLDCSAMSSKAAEVAEKSMKSRESGRSVEDKVDSSRRVVNKIQNVKIQPFDTSNLRLTGIQMKSSMLLDGCKIYLSGIGQDLFDQIRKLINTAGGMRFNVLNSNVTHIIVGDVVSNDVIQFLEDNIQKPFVVSPNWLVDSCRMGEVLKEEVYCLLEKDEIIMAKPTVTPRKGSGDVEKKKDARNVPSFQLDDDLEDDVFFGQYLPQAESSRISFVTENKIPAAKEKKEEQGIIDDLQMSDYVEAIAGPKLDKSKVNTPLSNKTFQQCKFVVKFFEKETAEQVKSLIQEFNGKVINQESRADYVIVPLTYEKKRRVGKKEVTIFWLEQSIESETLLDKNSCFLYRPFHLPPDCLPLRDLVMTVSQFSGIQREHMIQLGDLLGALMQDSFVRKATEDLHANTHLLLAEASGPKYEAACKWGVTCVTKEWLFACGENKKLMPVEDFPLQHEQENDDEERDGEEKEGKNEGDMKDDNRKEETRYDIKENASEHEVGLVTAQPAVKSSSNDHPTHENGTEESHDQGDNLSANPQAMHPPTTPSIKVEPLLQRGKPFKPSFDLGDMMEYLKSPATCFTPRTKSRANRSSFAFDEFVGSQLRKALEITGGNSSKEPGTSDVIEQKSHESTRTHSEVGIPSTVDANEGPDKAMEVKVEHNDEKKDVMNNILQGVVIAVSKRLADFQTEIHNLASLLGADYRYIFEDSCTHLIHKGKMTDNLTEVKQARSLGKFIVSKHWLDSCLESNSRVQEELYPSTYNPKMSLSVVSKGRKSTRTSKSRSSQRTKIAVTQDSSETEERPKSSRKSSTNKSRNDSTLVADVKKEVRSKDLNDKTSIKNDDNDEKSSKGTSSESMISPPPLENTSSLDARLEFKRQIEEIMEATKGNKGVIHRTRRQPLGSASPNDDSSLKRSSVAKRLRSRQSSQKSNSDSTKSFGDRKQNSRVTSFPTLQPSQSDVITYDDPAGRLERERILAQLKAASPSQDGFQTPTELSDLPVGQIEAADPAQIVPPIEDANQEMVPAKDTTNNSKQDFSYELDHLSTPPHRPISMHIANPVQQPAPINLLEEDDAEENTEAERRTYKFILSAMTPQEKIHYSAMIEELGGVICDSQYFTLECSHVVVGTPNRNEKFLASVAAGKWVLHKSYLEASREAGLFVQEEDHEWGTEKEPSKLTMAVRRWRKKLSKERKLDSSAGAFKGWHVLLCVGSSVKQHGFKRMLEAGSGKVGTTHPPFKNLDGVTHAFIDPNKAKPGLVDYEKLYSSGIWVLRPEYIVDYLTLDPPPSAQKYVISEVQKLMETESKHDRSSDTKKRKYDEDMSSQKMKRTRK